jgi:PKD repeat protein
MKAKKLLTACLPGLLAILFVITVHGEASALEQYYVDSTAIFAAFTETSYDIEAGDVDGDGDLDIIVTNNGQNRLYINDGSGNFMDATARFPLDADITYDADFGDVDGDGDLDVFLVNREVQNRLYINDGTGVFTDETSTRLPIDADKSIEGDFGDVDGDGDLDIIVINNLSQNRLYINDGTGVFTDGTSGRLPVEAFADCDGDFGDVDRDGDLDLAIGNCDLYSAQNRLLMNDGTGVFTDETSARVPVFLDGTPEVEMGVSDVDGDGDLDILFANGGSTGSQQNRILINQGTYLGDPLEGYFVEETSTRLPGIIDDTRDMDLGDVDNDGDLDVIVVNKGVQNRLLINNGSGVFSDQTTSRLPVDTDNSREADFADVDGDGYLDIIVANLSGGQNRLLINDGTGNYTDETAARLPYDADNSKDMEFADVDGDGDMDVIVANDGQNRLYINVNVNPNTAPAFSAAIGNQAVDEDEVSNIPISATDAEGGVITLSATNLPPFATFTDYGGGTGMLTLSPIDGDDGVYTGVVITACDDADPQLCASETITITVNNVNTPPVANAGADESTYVDEAVLLSGSATDADSDPIVGWSWAVDSQPPASTPVFSSAAISNPAFFGDVAGNYLLSLMASDGTDWSAPGTMTVHVLVNDPPVASASSDVTGGDAPLTVNFNGSSSSDPEGGALIYVWDFGDGSLPSGEVSPTHTYTTPGTYNAVLTVTDDNGQSTDFTIIITVDAPNSAPVANPDSASTTEDTPVTTGDVLANDTDVDGDTLSVSGYDSTSANGGTVAYNGDGTFTYTPPAGFSGTDTFTYTVSDGNGGTDVGTVTITVDAAPNTAPTADAGSDQLVTVGYEVNLSGDGSSDPEDDPLTYAWAFTSIPAGSTAVLSGAASAYPTFTADLEGVYTVQLTVSDGSLSSSDTVTVTTLGSEFEVKIAPTTLNLETNGNPVSVFVQLPLEYTVTDVDPAKLSLFMVFYECTVAPCTVTADLSTYNVNTSQNKFSIKFPRADVEALLNANNAWGRDITIRVQGGFYTGTPYEAVTFYGDDVVRVNQ